MTEMFKMPGTNVCSMRKSQRKPRSKGRGRRIVWAVWLGVMTLCALPARAQIDLSSLDRLSERAGESVEINLDKAAIQLAGGFLSAGKGKGVTQVHEILSKLTAITVRTLEFKEDGDFSNSDLNDVRNQLRSPAWSRIVNITGADENVEVYIRQANDVINGVTALVAENKELTVASIEGEIDLQALAALGGSFGLPKLPIPAGKGGDGKAGAGKGGSKN